ncbi:MAG TPA: alpha/beta fold hydrolase [Candidatus Hydrogenedentes bacterium]|nr:alpha/beta fold hydrolase [Candidatus Hydrogenedentota bacterium]
MADSQRQEIDRIVYPVVFREQSSFKDTYAGAMDMVFFDCQLLRPKSVESKTVIVFSHPIGGGAWLPLVSALAHAGHHVIYANTRFRGNDTALVMEKCVVDLGQAIKHAKQKLGYEKIVLGGWSGGGSLSLFYQQQAERPSVTQTPAGDPPDLTTAGLIPADGLMLLAAHISRAGTLTEWMDPSILDEDEPDQRDPELNLYNPENPNQPPYWEAFVARFREAQIARNRRITARVKEQLTALQSNGSAQQEYCFTVYGTMMDVRWQDPTIDANQRKPNTCYLGDPEVVNDGPVGLARFCTLRSWLSQWSYDDSNADGVACARDITCPVIVIGNLADDACTPSHTHRLYEAVGHDDKELHEIDGATHYYIGQDVQLAEATGHCTNWLSAKGLD